jgi:hypothetical protein
MTRGIEYYYRGPEAETLAASFKQMKQYAAQLKSGEHVLYLNTLSSGREIERVADSVSRRHRAKVMTMTLTSTTFAARLQFLGLTVAAKQIRVIILNCIDFAARTTNQKKALVHWLREMRDVHECRVIVYGIHATTDEGAIGQLKYVIEREVSYDRWTKQRALRSAAESAAMICDEDEVAKKHPSEAAEQFVSEIEQELPVIEEEMEEEMEAEFIDEAGVIARSRHFDFSASGPIKINDLTGAHRAQRAMKNEELRMKNEVKVEELEFA